MNALPTNESERLWTVQETAKYLHVSTSWVYRATERGEVPHLKLGGLLRYQPDQVRAYAASLASTAAGGAKVVRLASRKGGR